DFDDAQHHDPAADANRPAAGVVHRAVPFRGVVNDDKAFWLVTRLIASSLGGHACPGAAPNRRMVPRGSRFRQAASLFLTPTAMESNPPGEGQPLVLRLSDEPDDVPGRPHGFVGKGARAIGAVDQDLVDMPG